MKKLAAILITICVAWWGCQKPYNPRPIAVASNYLVVEGVINTGSDSTIIHLSRTVPLTSTAGTTPEPGATITIVSDAGSSYPLIETGKGYYMAPGLNLTTANNYSLNITTSDGKVYKSDFVPAKNSPPIDSIYYRIQSNGLQIYADTHDPANNTKYYRWDYTGTYEFHSAFNSFLYLSTTPVDSVMVRPIANQIYVCWRSDVSSTILINSSAKLTKDIITQNPIEFISSTSEALENRYSILVKQYALTPDAYNYYQQLKKNTEQLGSIFDPQPSEIPGNIHCITTPSEPVLGYITAGSPAETRIFIDNRNLPAWQSTNPYSTCVLDTDLYNRPVGRSFINEVELYIYAGINTPLYAIQPPGAPHPLGYAASQTSCVDCTLRGTNKQPSFWISE
jgi:Domain of unknown function (DUF4249)